MISALLKPRVQAMRNMSRSDSRERGKVALFGILGALLWLGLYLSASWFLGKCLDVEPIGELLVEKVLDLTLLVVFSALLFSNVINAFSTFYLSEDLQLLMSQPIDSVSLYTARFVETSLLSGWMPLVFALPIFVSAGVLFGAPWGFFLMSLLALCSLLLTTTALAVPLTLVLTRALPAQRTKEVLMFLGVLGFVFVFIVVRAINPAEMLNPSKFGSTMEVFATLQNPSASVLPSGWALSTLRPMLRGEGVALRYLMALLSTPLALYFVGAWSFRRWHREAYSRAQEGRHGGGGWEQLMAWFKRERQEGEAATQTALAQLGRVSGRLSPNREMVLKDARIFVRDTAQWSQVVLLLALVIIYLLNFRYFRTLGLGGVVGQFGLYLTNIALCGFVAAALGVRFVFPAVSLEGRSFWLLRVAPLGMRDFLRQKWLVGALPLLLLSEVLTVCSNVLIGAPWPMTLISACVIGSLSLGLSGLGVGLGALYPRFDLDSAAKIATGFGGVLYMVLGLALVLVVIALTTTPAWVGFFTLSGGVSKPQTWLLASLSFAGVLTVPLGVGVLALRSGVKRLEMG